MAAEYAQGLSAAGFLVIRTLERGGKDVIEASERGAYPAQKKHSRDAACQDAAPGHGDHSPEHEHRPSGQLRGQTRRSRGCRYADRRARRIRRSAGTCQRFRNGQENRPGAAVHGHVLSGSADRVRRSHDARARPGAPGDHGLRQLYQGGPGQRSGRPGRCHVPRVGQAGC